MTSFHNLQRQHLPLNPVLIKSVPLVWCRTFTDINLRIILPAVSTFLFHFQGINHDLHKQVYHTSPFIIFNYFSTVWITGEVIFMFLFCLGLCQPGNSVQCSQCTGLVKPENRGLCLAWAENFPSSLCPPLEWSTPSFLSSGYQHDLWRFCNGNEISIPH
jgi:hypothetical protein